jgi:NADH-quinone oxidoreductase subunit N
MPKVAGFVALYLVVTATLQLPGLGTPGTLVGAQATGLFWILATVSMFIGNILALLQTDLKRLLAYSSVAHAGYMLIGLGAGRAEATTTGIEALFFYLVVYGAMTVGAFAVIAYLNRVGAAAETVDDLSGLGRSHPGIALLLTAFLFSLTGLPPTAGFWGKLNLFFAAWSVPAAEQGRLFKLLAIFLALNAAIAAWYYLQIVGVMYLRDRRPGTAPATATRETPGLASLVLCAVLTLGFFVTPGWLWRQVEQASTPVGTGTSTVSTTGVAMEQP